MNCYDLLTFFSLEKCLYKIKNTTLFWSLINKNIPIYSFAEYKIMYVNPIYGLYHINTYEFNHYLENCKWAQKWLQKAIMNKYQRNDNYAKELVKDITKHLYLIEHLRAKEIITKRGLPHTQNRWDAGIAFYYAIDELQKKSEKIKDTLDNYAKNSLKTKVFDRI